MTFRLEDLVECKPCFALVVRDHLAQHLEWHARLNARLLAPHDCSIYHEKKFNTIHCACITVDICDLRIGHQHPHRTAMGYVDPNCEKHSDAQIETEKI